MACDDGRAGRYRSPRTAQRLWLEWLEVEHDNLRAALAWSREDPRGAEAILRLTGALSWFWYFHGYWREARGWLEEALNRRRDAPRVVLPRVYEGASHYAWRFGDDDRAKMLGEEGLAIARDLADKRSTAFLLANLGVVAIRQMVYGEAAERFEESVRLAREAGDKWLVSLGMSHQGILARHQGDLNVAAVLHEEALPVIRETGDTAMVSYTLRCLGIVALQQGDYQRAAEFFAESLRLSRETGFRWIYLECLVGLAGVSSAHRRGDQAARLFGAAETLREAIGHHSSPQDQADHDQRLASTRRDLGETAFAAAWAEGRAMTLEQAIEYALKVDEGVSKGDHG